MERITLSKKKLILGLLLQIFTIAGYSQSQTFTSSGTFNTSSLPSGVNTVTVEVWGGGGKGGDRTAAGGAAGAGGGGYSRKLITVPASSYTVTVGGGSTTTAAGGDSWFGSTTTIIGRGGASIAANGTTGGAGGTAQYGDTNVTGGSGANATSLYGGGGGAGSDNTGTNPNASGATAGTTPNGGNGGNGRSATSGNGTAGTAPGGGGGGAYRLTNGTSTGGNGGTGRVVVYWGSEIDIRGNATSISDNDTNPTTGDWTDFGSAPLGTPITRTFTIYNTGYSTLTIGAITFSGSTDFSVTTAPASSVLPGGNTSFVVTFNATVSGTKNATISIVNNDSNENPYNYAIRAQATEPEINIMGNGTTIADGDTTPATGDFTIFGSTDVAAGTLTRTYLIQNVGTYLLNIGAITFSGANASDFTVTTAPASTINPGGSTNLVVTFNPSDSGVRNAMISIENDDANEDPYNFAIQGTGTEPEINVVGNGVNIVDGDTTPQAADFTSFGTTDVTSGTITKTFTIQNLNSANMALTVGAITFSGTNAADFSVTTAPASSVAVNSSTTFIVTFNPSGLGTRTATINIANSDIDENPYNFAIEGIGADPEINLQGNGVNIVDGDTTPTTADWTDFGGTAVAGGIITRTFTIQNLNTATMPLTVGSITFSGTHAGEFSVTTAPASSVAVNGSTTFVVTFNPNGNGLRTATMNIANNDSDENPYNISIQGTGESTEIDVRGNSISITSGSTSTSTSNYTDFGSTDITSGTITRTFYIHNTGSTVLNLSSISIGGLNPSDFTITSAPNMTISAGSFTYFTIVFNPTALLSRNATVTILSNDYDESNYTFAISGFGFIDTDGDGIENSADRDDDNDGILDSVECDTCALDPFVNGSFEAPVIGAATYAILPTSSVTGWQTSAENFIEIWSSGFLGVNAAAGNQFAELNANVPGLLYQTFCLSGSGGTISWSVKHRARQGTDQAFVKFGPNLSSLSTIATMVDGTAVWGTYSGTYTIPVGQTQILLAFEAGYTGSGDGSVGNFIDDIQIIINQNCRDTDGDGIANSLDLDSDNDGIPDIEEGGFKAYSNNFSKVSPMTDTNNNGVLDAIDSMVSGGTYSIPDSDGDGVPDYLDLDSDNDAIFDVDESTLTNGDGDINGDGFGDGPDSDGDGILNLYDNQVGFGTAFRAFTPDTDGDGIANYREIDANFDGVMDILTTLYGSFDANLDGRIDGSVDADKDGILDTFDTKPTGYGSPRDLNRKLFLDFDGRNDYGEAPQMLSALPQSTIMCWIKLNSVTGTTMIIGQDNFRLWMNGSTILASAKGGVTTSYATPLTINRWYHVCAVYNGGSSTEKLRLYINGQLEGLNNASSLAGALDASTARFTIAKHPTAASQYLNASIDEIRVFNSALTTDIIQKMVYQEIRQNGTAIRGEIVPRDIESSAWGNLIAYYRMDAYKDDVIDNYTTGTIDSGLSTSFARIYNNKVISYQLAPMPFVTTQAGAVDAAVSQNNFVYGNDLYTYNWSILQMRHNINLSSNMTNLGLFVNPAVTFNLTNDNLIRNTWYLKLDGKLDLQGRSQLVQTSNSILDATSAGFLERDQQGTVNKWNYNYWSSPVGEINATTNNNNYTVAGVFKDGTNTAVPQNITWTSGLNGSPTTPITLSSYWIFKFQNVTNAYANWATVGPNGTLLAGQGFTLKGSSAATPTQNYVFVGKPHNGSITSPIAPNNLNLSGNPYASALDANQFINDNLGALTGTIYFWEHFSTNTTHVLEDYQGGYATYTLVGGTPPVAPSGISGLGSSSRQPKRFIPVGQGFFLAANATGGNINFNNGQRAFVKENDATSSVMFRNSVSAETMTVNNNSDAYEEDTYARVRVGFNSANNYHRQVLLGFMEEHANAAINPGYDASHFDNQPNDMYFLTLGQKLNIQGDGYFNQNNIYPLGVKIGNAGLVSFTLDGKENFDDNQPVYIYDAVTNLYHDIRNDKFEITLPTGNFDTRFSLRFTGGTSLGNGEATLENGIFVAYTNNNGSINIKNNVTDTTVESVSLYNMLGQSISTWDVEVQDQQNIIIPVKNLASGTYIVKMKTTKGDISKKIIIK